MPKLSKKEGSTLNQSVTLWWCWKSIFVTQITEAGILGTWRRNPIIEFLEQFQRNFNFDKFFWFINIEICLKELQNLTLSYKKFSKQLFGDIIKRLWWTLFSKVADILYTLYWHTKWPKINNWIVSAINISYPKSTSQIPFIKLPLFLPNWQQVSPFIRGRNIFVHTDSFIFYNAVDSENGVFGARRISKF